MNPTEKFKIPEEKKEEFDKFLEELVEIAQNLRGVELKEILENWETIMEEKEEDPEYWHLDK